MSKVEQGTGATKKSFCNWSHNKIQFRFPNGNFLSTVWGKYSYCENHDLPVDFPFEEWLESDDCEVMFECSEKLAKKIAKKFPENASGDIFQPYGHLKFDEWLWLVNQLSKDSLVS